MIRGATTPAALLLALACTARAGEAQPGNVLFIAVDDLKPTIHALGDPTAITPNIDRLAARGVSFRHAYCQQAVCAPSRNSVLTGLRPETMGIYDLGTFFRSKAPDAVTLPQHLKAHGWETGALGKIFHVGSGNHDDPASWSVPTIEVPTHGDGAWTALVQPVAGSQRKTGPAWVEAADGDRDLCDITTADNAIARLGAWKDRRFFLGVGFIKPHLPFVAPKHCFDRFPAERMPLATVRSPPIGAPAWAGTDGGELRQYSDIPQVGPLSEAQERMMIRGYYAAVNHADEQVGRVVDELDRLGLSATTTIVLWGDHGWHLGDHGFWCKHTNYEQATRAPLIIVPPGGRAAATCDALVELLDIYPTICQLAGAPAPARIEGSSLVPLIADPAATGRKAAGSVFPRKTKEHGEILGHALRTAAWRYVEWRRRDDGREVGSELYDMVGDPNEIRNLAADPARATVVAGLRELLAAGPAAWR